MTEYLAPGVYIEEVSYRATSIDGVPTAVTGFIGAASGPGGAAVRVPSVGAFTRTFGAPDRTSELGCAVLQYFANGGGDAWVVARSPDRPIDDALAALDAVPDLALLCLPGETDQGAIRAALSYAEGRGAFLIVDAPGADADAAVALVASLGETGSSNGAVYFPPVLIADPTDPAESRSVAPSGSVAGIYARTDASRGVWKAPSGLEAVVLGVRDPAVALSEAEVARLEAAGVNVIRPVPRIGPVVWGARTVQGAEANLSEYRYVPVRRFVTFVERSVGLRIRWAASEQNDDRLWAALRRDVGAFLAELFRAGAFPTTRPEEAYFVRCDRSTMTQDDIDHGLVRVVVGVAPVRPAEFVIVGIGTLTGRVASEVLGPATGAPRAAFALAHAPVSPEGVVLQVEGPSGWTTWLEVNDLGAAGPDDAVFMVDRGTGTVRFGDGEHGAAPPGGARIEATYRYGSGDDGRDP